MSFYGLDPSTHYVVNVLPGMADIYGNAITSSYSFSFTTGPYQPSAYFLMPYTPSLFRAGGPQTFYASIVNVRQVNYALYHLSPQDFVSVMNGGNSWSDYQPVSMNLGAELVAVLQRSNQQTFAGSYYPPGRTGEPGASGYLLLDDGYK